MTAFTLSGEKFELVDAKLTFAEAAAFEKVTGVMFADAMDNERLLRSALCTQAMLWISIKRVKPTTAFAELDSIAMDDIEWEADEDEAADPSDGDEDSQTSD